jgi:transcriptional regulator with XRE-family HTH domain
MRVNARPSALLIRLSQELQRLRTEARITQEDVRAATGISAPTLSRIENAKTPIPPETVERLLDLYKAPDALRAQLVGLASDAALHGLRQSAGDIWPSGFVKLEGDASKVFTFELAFVPGLLQIPEYYRALIQGCAPEPPDPAEVERKVSGRIGRQALMTRENPPLLHVVISELVIRQMVGGPVVMRNQLKSLAEVSGRPNVTLQVIPFAAGANCGLDGSFTILDFATYDLQLGYTEGPAGHIYLESPPRLQSINVRREGVLKVALSPGESTDLLTRAADSILGVICSHGSPNRRVDPGYRILSKRRQLC